jgi:hypothetical protein
MYNNDINDDNDFGKEGAKPVVFYIVDMNAARGFQRIQVPEGLMECDGNGVYFFCPIPERKGSVEGEI